MDTSDPRGVGVVDGPRGHSRWVERLRRWDPVTWVLFFHAVILLTLGEVAHVRWGVSAAVGLLVWRISLEWSVRRSRGDRRHWLEFAKGAGSLVLAGAMMWADGGTESPFFFWPLILLGWQVLVHPVRRFEYLSSVGVVVYVGVVLVVPDLTAASLGRLVLLAAYCGILVMGRLRLEAGEAAAERAAHLLRDAFWAAPVGLAVVEGEALRVVYANQTAHVMRLFSDKSADDGSEKVEALVRKAKEKGETVGPHLVEVGWGNRYLRVLATPHSLNGYNGAVVCAEDVTAQVTVGEERRRFLQLASHQLRTPLTPIVGYAELLREKDMDRAALREAAETILGEAERLEHLFDRMATVVRLQHESRRDSVETTMEDVLDELTVAAPKVLQGVELAGDPQQQLRCHTESVVEALRELLDNGHRFGEPPVRLGWRRRDHILELTVSDAGEGPAPDLDQDDLFGEWGRRKDLDLMPRGMGTRLGLLQARLLVSLTGGRLEFERSKENWAFVMQLGAGTSQAEQPTAAHRAG